MSAPWEGCCITCLLNGKEVVGNLEDFARRCPQHLPNEGPDVIYVSMQTMSEYTARMWPKRNVVIMDLKGER